MSFEYEVHFWFEYTADEKQCAYSDEYVFRSPQEALAKCSQLQSRENMVGKRLVNIMVDKVECCDSCGEWVRRQNDYMEYVNPKEAPWVVNKFPACTCNDLRKLTAKNAN